MSIAWIASYPKSGNTWVRFLLYSAIYGPPQRSLDIAKRIADIHRPTETLPPAQGPSLIKTHFLLNNEHPSIEQSVKAIHIIRNPRDVLLSSLHYHKMTKDRILGVSSKQFALNFIKHGGNQEWLKPFGTWTEHTESWRRTDRFPVLALRYEDIKQSPRTQLDRMIEFLELDIDENDREQAVDASSFESMRALEAREKSKNPSADPEGRPFVGTAKAAKKGQFFINKGATGQSLDGLSQGLDAKFDDAFRSALAEHGYPLS